MAVLTVDGTEYAVMQGVEMEPIRMDRQRRAWSGVVRSTLPSDTLEYVRAWQVSCGYLTVTEAETLLDVLQGTDAFDIAGDLPGETVSCMAVDIQREDGPLDDMVTIRVRLEEVGA